MRNLFWIVLLLRIVSSCENKETPIKPSVGTITQSVYASATVQPDSLYEVFANVSGILESNLVSEGDLVKKGTPLFQIINSNTKLNTENARLAYSLAKKNYSGNTALLLSIEDEIKAAKLKFNNDSINYFRQKNLWEQHIGSKAQLDAQKLAYELSANAVTALKTKYNRLKNELRTQLNQAANSYENLVITTQDYTVTSKMDGKVYALYKNPGEVVSMQQPIAMIGSQDSFVLELLVDEVDIVNIAEGQKVAVALDAYPNETFVAQVTKIYPNKNERNQTFKVEARFSTPPKRLYPGLSGEGNIIIAVQEDVLLIPRAYLFEQNKVKTSSGIVEVTTGIITEEQIEIRSGITSETELLRPENL